MQTIANLIVFIVFGIPLLILLAAVAYTGLIAIASGMPLEGTILLALIAYTFKRTFLK